MIRSLQTQGVFACAVEIDNGFATIGILCFQGAASDKVIVVDPDSKKVYQIVLPKSLEEVNYNVRLPIVPV